MLDLNQLQFLAQMMDSMEVSVEKLEKSYEENDGENLQNSKKAILVFQSKISENLEETRENIK